MTFSGFELMAPSQRRYVAVETVISMVINTLISVGFVYLAFGGTGWIATAALIPDALPQSFMIALMGTIVPALLTRKRMRAGIVDGLDRQVPKLLRSLPALALLVAFVAAIAGLAVHAAVLINFAPNGLSFGTALAFKAIFGGMLAGIVTLATLPLALAERSA